MRILYIIDTQIEKNEKDIENVALSIENMHYEFSRAIQSQKRPCNIPTLHG